jgi:hypothetical protein
MSTFYLKITSNGVAAVVKAELRMRRMLLMEENGPRRCLSVRGSGFANLGSNYFRKRRLLRQRGGERAVPFPRELRV